MLSIAIDRAKCSKCRACVDICCNSRVIETDDDGYPVYKNIHKCISCGHCIAICPNHAISSHDTGPRSDDIRVTGEIELTGSRYDPTTVTQLLAGTRSERSFLPKTVETDKIRSVLDAMIRAPSAGNEQNRNYYVFSSRDQIDGLERDIENANAEQAKALANPILRKLAIASLKGHVRKTYAENGRELSAGEIGKIAGETIDSLSVKRDHFFFKDAPVVIVVTSKTSKKGMHAKFYKADVEIAVTHGTILATSLGLSSCRLGLAEIFFGNKPALRAKYGFPKTERVDGVLALGYSDTAWKRIPPRGPAKVTWK